MIMKLWENINNRNWDIEKKFHAFRVVLEIISGIIGLLVWMIIRRFGLQTYDWMICFIGYPVVISWFVSLVYQNYHEFCDGIPQ